jgi:hypothetical protein
LLNILEVYISEADSIHFSIANNTCNVLNTSGTCSISVQFNPQSTGYKYAKLRIISNDPEQPDLRVPLEGIGEVATHISAIEENSIIVYPNPATDHLNLKVENYETNNLSYQLFNINGILLLDRIIEGPETDIVIRHFTAGTYFLKVIDKQRDIKTFKIMKKSMK